MLPGCDCWKTKRFQRLACANGWDTAKFKVIQIHDLIFYWLVHGYCWHYVCRIRVCRPLVLSDTLARIIHEQRRETAQKLEAARRALFWKAECIGKSSMPFKTSPTQQNRTFQRLQ
jgi:hypothetical protein